MESNEAKDSWFAEFFSGATLDIWRNAIPLEQTEDELNFLCQVLEPPEQGKLLDVPCGNGRLSIPLSLFQFEVTGVDFSDEFIAEANAAAQKQGANCSFTKADMRHLNWENEFDAAFCMGNSFGYFDYNDTLDFFTSINRSLKADARFVLDSQMLAESFLVNGAEREWTKVAGTYLLIENKYDCKNSSLETTYTYLKNGKEEQRKATHWIYTSGELCRMLEHCGFKILDLFESTEGEPFSIGSDRLLIIVQKG